MPHSRPRRYLWWLVTQQRRRIVGGAVLGTAWMIGLTLPPYVLSRAIDDGLQGGSLVWWCAALLGVGAVTAWLGVMRHRTMTRVRREAAFSRVEGLAAAPRESRSAAVAPADDRIEISAVRYGYDERDDVLHDVSLSIRPGERLAIVGPSGAGKTTLARLIAGVDAPRSGAVTVGNVPVSQLDPSLLREHVALVTQEHHVFVDTLRGNLQIAAPAASDEKLRTALAAVGASWVDELPAGLDTTLGAGGVGLDGSWAQQLSLARVVLADPHTLILDEATALLDPTTARQTERALAAVLSGRTVIAIAHRLHTAHDADRVAVMADGRLTELGTHDELVAASGTYAALWHSWHGEPA